MQPQMSVSSNLIDFGISCVPFHIDPETTKITHAAANERDA